MKKFLRFIGLTIIFAGLCSWAEAKKTDPFCYFAMGALWMVIAIHPLFNWLNLKWPLVKDQM